LAERFHGMEEVKGSIPFSSTQETPGQTLMGPALAGPSCWG
jgi:hypothetical protein